MDFKVKPSPLHYRILGLFNRRVTVKEFDMRLGGMLRIPKSELQRVRSDMRKDFPQSFRRKGVIEPPRGLL
jgi:hypothetical protein